MENHEKMNKQIEAYIDTDNPNYALLLRGAWGCGKTYFAENELQKNKELKGKAVFFYYSLNGAPDTVNVINSIYIELITSQVFAE